MERLTAAQFQQRYGSHDPSPPRLRSTQPKEQTPALGKSDARKAQSSERPLVRFTLRRLNLLDADSKHGTLKDLLDSCVYAGLIPGDREDQICLEVDQKKVSTKGETGTDIEIIYP